jgi:KaiC/GvpD/RAD55 family RecA-like ATPase
LAVSISQRTDIFADEFKKVEDLLTQLDADKSNTDQDWLNDATEKFCQERAVHNALMESILIMDGKSKHDKGMIPKILTDALAVTFDPNVGHDYLEDSDERFAYYHRKSKKYPFDIDYFNKITGGGLEPKTLNVILAGTNVGKTLMMCHFAAAWLAQHFNVLYITMEMSQEKISQRIDANLMDITIDDLMMLPKDQFDKRINKMKEKYKGKLIVKEYPTASAGSNHFRALMNELLMKKKFKPDVVIIDYINICTSARVKMGNNVNSYTLIKSIAEELRGLAVEFNMPVLSATQTTRSGYSNSDPDMTDTSESWGLPQTVDEMWVATSSEELAKLNQLCIKRLKSRSGDVNQNKRFVVGVNYGKMKLSDVAENDQHLYDSGQEEADDTLAPKSAYDKFKTLNRFD